MLNKLRVPSEVDPKHYDAFFYPGGHGPLWDLASDSTVGSIAAKIYEQGGVVGAVCHGPCGLLSVKLSNGQPIVQVLTVIILSLTRQGKKVTGFSNEEEEAVNLTKVVPFSLEDQLKAQGGSYSAAPKFQAHVVSDQRLVTGENPGSSTGVAEEIVKVLHQ